MEKKLCLDPLRNREPKKGLNTCMHACECKINTRTCRTYIVPFAAGGANLLAEVSHIRRRVSPGGQAAVHLRTDPLCAHCVSAFLAGVYHASVWADRNTRTQIEQPMVQCDVGAPGVNLVGQLRHHQQRAPAVRLQSKVTLARASYANMYLRHRTFFERIISAKI